MKSKFCFIIIMLLGQLAYGQTSCNSFNCVAKDSLILNESDLVCIKSNRHLEPLKNSFGEDSVTIYTFDGELMALQTEVYTLTPYSGCALSCQDSVCLYFENYLNGKKNGIILQFFPTGELKYTGYFKANIPIGEHILYEKPNVLTWKCNYDMEGKENGICEIITNEGHSTFRYEHGKLIKSHITKHKKTQLN